MQFEHVRVNMGVNIYNTVVNILNTRTIKLNTNGHVMRLISLLCRSMYIQAIVIAVGLNDQLATQPPFVNAATRLLDYQTRRVVVFPVPHISNATPSLRQATSRVNLILREALVGTDHVYE